MQKYFSKRFNLLSSKAAFTLAEMLAVTVILSILVALAIGTFRKALERARFQEGLRAAETVAAAVERYYYENPDLGNDMSRYQPTMDQLDIELSNAQPCEGGVMASGTTPYCLKIKNFEIQIEGTKINRSLIPLVVFAYRGKAYRSALVADYKYEIGVIPSIVRDLYTGSTPQYKNEISRGGMCVSHGLKHNELCASMGYTQQCSNLSLVADPSETGARCKK